MKKKKAVENPETLCILKVISKKSSQMLTQHLAESSGTKVNTSTRRESLIKNGPRNRLQLRNHFCRKAKQREEIEDDEDYKAGGDDKRR